MEYRDIVAVTGLSGLFQLVTSKSDGAVVRNIGDKTTKFISARLHTVTPLESIEIYTTGENVRLHDILTKMKEHEPDVKKLGAKSTSNDEVRAYFQTIVPDFDEERVYVSDMKKIVKWYDMLKENSLLDFTALEEAANKDKEGISEEAVPVKPEAEIIEEKETPKPKKATKKKAAKKSDEGEEMTKKTAPKKSAAKKKTEE